MKPLLVDEPPLSMEARVYLDHHVSQEEHRIQLTSILALLRSTLLCKQWFGSDSFLPVASQGGRMPLSCQEEGEGEGMFPILAWSSISVPCLGLPREQEGGCATSIEQQGRSLSWIALT